MYQREIDDLKKNIEEMQANLKKLEDKAASPGRCRAEYGGEYWFVGGSGKAVAARDFRTAFDNDHWESGNYYRTEEEAERFKKLHLAVKRQMPVPKQGDTYWTISVYDKNIANDYWSGQVIDLHRYALGIVFPTEQVAQAYLDAGLADVLLKEAWGE